MVRRKLTTAMALGPHEGMLPLPYAVGVLLAMAVAAWVGVWTVRQKERPASPSAVQVVGRN
jgi:uncharacterized membrane protein YfcA